MKINELKAGAVLSYLSIFITIIVSLLYTPIMLRLLGQSEYGLYSLIGSVVGYLSILDMGLGNAMVRYNARNRALGDKEAESRLNGMFLILYSGIGILTVIMGAILYLNMGAMFGNSLTSAELVKGRIMMILLIFNFAVSFPLGIFGSIMQAYEKFVFLKLVTIIRSILMPCMMLPFLYAGFGAVAMVVVNTILNISVLLINLIYCLRKLKIKMYFKGFDYPLLGEILGYSFFIFLNAIVDKVYWSTGQFILGIVSGTVLVAIFAVAMQLNTMYMMFSTAVSGVFLPKITMMVANNASNDDLSQLMIKVGRVQYIVMSYILSGFILFGQAFIKLWAGTNYGAAYYIVLLVMVPITIPLIQNIGISILQAQNRNAFRSIVYVAIAVVNVLVSIPLARIWGGFGCALATGMSLVIGNIIVMNIYYYRQIGLNIPLFWRNIAQMTLPIAVALLGGYGLNCLIVKNGVLLLGAKILLFSVIYILIMWVWGLNIYEKELFMLPLKRILPVKSLSQLEYHD